MSLLKKLFNFYINASLHVALSVYSLVRMTQFLFKISNDDAVAYFAFFGTIVGYNFVKYDFLVRIKRQLISYKLKGIVLLSFISLCAGGFFFLQLPKNTQLTALVFLILTTLYALPFFPNRKNARNWAGVKIYIVALCWVGVTVFLPVLNSGIPVGTDLIVTAIQRFILVFVLILIFEIIDLAKDDPHLKTVPQQIGVRGTKNLGYFLLLFFCGLEVFTVNIDNRVQYLPLLLRLIVAIITALFLAFANEKRSKYYTSFWAESIPIVWWLLLLFLLN